MGFFSWETSDTHESIANIHSNHNNSNRIVYLLQPNGDAPIVEKAYDGYGNFGGVDAYEWLALKNLDSKILAGLKQDDIRSFGIAIAMGSLYKDANGNLWSFHYPHLFQGVKSFPGSYATVIPEFGLTPNELLQNGDWEEISIRDYLGGIKYPLKFSFMKNAIYENLDEAESCRYQGYFYDDEDEDED